MLKQSILLLMVSAFALTACGETAKIDEVKKQSLEDFIFVKGGTFTMGDFGTVKDGRRLHYSILGIEGKEPHQVTLTSYSLAKNKVTWFEYDTFLLATGRPLQKIEMRIDSKTKRPLALWNGSRPAYQTEEEIAAPPTQNFYIKKPAAVQWQDAKDYCQWLGKALNLPIDLATEAQWEYAARAGGKEVLFSNSLVDINKNPGIIQSKDIPDFIGVAVEDRGALQPIGALSTPNHLGFVDMDTNGTEWVNDWYSKTYFTDYPTITDPKGPKTGTEKVTKLYKFTFDRATRPATNFYTFRCAVNSDKSIN